MSVTLYQADVFTPLINLDIINFAPLSPARNLACLHVESNVVLRDIELELKNAVLYVCV